FLPCVCVPAGDLSTAPPRDEDLFSKALVHSKELLSPDVLRLRIEAGGDFQFRPGQFINLRGPENVVRSYSLAGLMQDYFLELHVKRMTNGALSNWLFDTLQPGDEIDIQGPQGSNVYVSADLNQPLLLIAAGTGLAPLLGILRDALASGHSGPIHLYHGSHHPHGLYLHDDLLTLAAQHPSVRYTACVSRHDVPAGLTAGRANDVAFIDHPDLTGYRVFAAGVPAMVQDVARRAAAAGVHAAEIHADPFEYRDLRDAARQGSANLDAERARDPKPDPELWAALGQGDLLTLILTDFYTRVYDDPRLNPFFHGITKQRSIEKQFSFLQQVMTGEKCYFGDRPRNAHHWMVISDELFDYREDIMIDCLRRHGLSETMIRRWRAMEEGYRTDIVKTAAWPRRLGDIELPLDGFGEETMSAATLCDSCQREINVGEKVRYHLRLGTTYCAECAANLVPATPS
ncbi:MAG: FAD-binding oxidoreductase, partial [Gammaproteobacteria bacterium]|nr:FAD-binding oxidoreductase [Gammaproteobacteria bacterium]